MKWITLAAAKGLPEALFRFGKMFEQGAVFRESIKDAIYWFGKSGERGHQDGEKEARRLTVLLATQRAVGEAGKKKLAAIDPDPNNSSETTIVVDNSVAPRVPPSPSEPQIAKIVAETPAIPETRPEIHGWRVQLASIRTIGEAKRAWKNLKRAFA